MKNIKKENMLKKQKKNHRKYKHDMVNNPK